MILMLTRKIIIHIHEVLIKDVLYDAEELMLMLILDMLVVRRSVLELFQKLPLCGLENT